MLFEVCRVCQGMRFKHFQVLVQQLRHLNGIPFIIAGVRIASIEAP